METIEVLASADGIITDVCLQPLPEITCGPNGPFVQVEHRAGFLTIYGHLDPASVTLRRKTPVAQGQPLGMAGAWGTDSAPWIHFELRHDNQGAGSGLVLETLDLEGRKFSEYRAGQVLY
jgi:murein DD-endopeptidase MepM/ murein hydrolase activator NlpD